ncbi:UNVERIFIED_ORG: DUF3597 domain-containing protein [Roseateles sp. XES5]|nr:DUF3597 domain-containing protein [Roseateles sp. XES5]
MGIFSSIKEKLFGKAAEETPAGTVTAEAVKPVTADVSATPTKADASATAATAGKDVAVTPAAGTATSSAPVDVAAIMDAAVKKNGQKLDWRKSIVDMMKALDLDSSLSARKELADELGYTGDKNDSATMNVWLHKALMKALAENGGKVPADLLD